MSTLRAAQLFVLCVAVADWAALKNGWLGHPPALFALVVAVLMTLLTADFGIRLSRLSRGTRRGGRELGQLLALAGLLVACGAGMANWLLSLQGYVVLAEAQRVELAEGEQLQGFEAGPLSDLQETGLSLELVELELLPVEGGFVPESRIVCRRPGQDPEPFAVRPGASGRCGSLLFHQGAFGFAPRIVILREARQVFDRVVPFLTRREGASGVSFEGDFNLASEGLHVAGVVDLEPLDARMRGHAKLRLQVSRAGRLMGRGELLLGHFADLEEGYRIGFAGLDKWSEIDVSRRSYRGAMLAGTATALAGALLWLGARVRA